MIQILLALVCALLWGLAEFYYKKNSETHKTTSILLYRYIFQVIVYILLILVIDINAFTRFDIKIYKFLLPFFLCSSVIGQVLYLISVKSENLSIVSPIMASDPVFIILIGLILFKEKISIIALIALAIICISICALNFVNSDTKKKTKKIIIFSASLYAFVTALSTTFEKSVYLSGYTVADLYFHYIFLILIAIIVNFIYLKIKHEKLEKISKNLILGFTFNQSGYILYSYLISVSYISLIAPITGLYSVITYFLATRVLKEKLSLFQKIFIYLILISTIVLLVFNS